MTDPHASTRRLMLLPSLACQAECRYCFGPNRGPVMPPDVFDAALAWIAATTLPGQSIELTLHGGEPLVVGHAWHRRHLSLLREHLDDRLKLGIQSNLWLLDDEYCELFREHRAAVGTSLDGPESINDAQRGPGHFARTMAGIETARRHGLAPGIICTFTRLSAPHYREVFEFFAREGLGFSVHAAVCGLADGCAGGRSRDGGDAELALTSAEKGALFNDLFDYYLANVTRARIGTFDSMARGISAGHGGLCTFTDCLGQYLTIAPDGGIFACNRFAHHPEWRLGRVQEQPDLDALAAGPVWRALAARELAVAGDCGDCAHFAYCKGGCAYNAAVRDAATGSNGDRRDPHCEAYRRVFSHIGDRALAEVFADENLAAVVEHGANGRGMLQRGPLLQIMRGGPHPQKVAARARETVACVALAESTTPREALQKLAAAGEVTDPDRALRSLQGLGERLQAAPRGLVNAYLHVTYGCDLACRHCYAGAGPQRGAAEMAVPDVAALVRAAADAGFRKAVITGGEPLAHRDRDGLLDALAALRPAVRPLQVVVRTNLARPLAEELLPRLARAADVIAVSVDGDEAGHDARRGPGAYARTMANLERLLAAMRQGGGASLQLAATLSARDTAGAAGDAVRGLAQRLGVPVRFKPVLPLGRAAAAGRAPERYNSLDDDTAAVACAPAPRATCGLGMNLHVAPDGDCHPCYALPGPGHALGNVLTDGLPAVLAANDRYRRVTVDSNARCSRCALRYLCGGACRAWSGGEPDAGPAGCDPLHAAARQRLLAALDALGIDAVRWMAAGLPLPEGPPAGA